jgi:hypothetical protein
MNMLLYPPVFAQPAVRPMKILQLPVVLQRPALSPINTLEQPVVLQTPAQNPAKKLLTPVPPVPLIQLTMLYLPHTENAPEPPEKGTPLILKPVLSTRRRSVEPAANTTVEHKPAVPRTDPMMVLQHPLTT